MNPQEQLEHLRAIGDETKKPSAETQKFIEESWALWGEQSDAVKQEGWYPQYKDPSNRVVTFRTNYEQAFNNVRINGEQELGHVAILGKPDKTFDVVVRSNTGVIKSYIYQNAPAAAIQSWLTASGNAVGTRKSVLPESATVVKK